MAADNGAVFRFDDRGLIPAIVQDSSSGRVLTLAYMNQEALRRTLQGPDVWFFSRSRNELWHKGETSGNYLRVKEVVPDCDGDAVLVKVDPTGPACHTGEESCFHASPMGVADLDRPDAAELRVGPGILNELYAVIQKRQRELPEGSYTTSLLRDGLPRIAQKVIEEAGEAAVASLTASGEQVAGELADVLYHALVMLAVCGVSPDDVWAVLQKRRQ